MKTNILRNLSWVLIGSVFIKVLGGFYRIILTRILGTSIGLYQMVFSLYSFLVILISSGIPMAISKQISAQKSEREHQKIINGSVFVLFSIAIIMALILVLGGKGIASLQGDNRIYLCYIILSPSLMFSAGGAILRGYYQGKHRFNTTAIAGVIDQIVRVVLGLIFMLILKRFYVLGALVGAMLGTLAGDVISFIYLKVYSSKIIKFNYSKKYIREGKNVFKNAYPIMLYSLIVPLSNFIDSIVVVKLLGIVLPRQTSILLYGLQSGVVAAMISVPSIFSFALTSVLMPSLSEDFANKNYALFNKKVVLAFRVVLFIALPFAIFFAVNSSNIINLIYGESINGFGVNGQYVATRLLTISSISVIFSSINQLSAVVLQNLNKTNLPLINLGLGMACKFIVELMFVPSGKLGIYAYGIAIAVGFVVSGVLNMYELEKYCTHIFNTKYLVKQFILSTIVFAVFVIFKLFNSGWVFVLGSLFTVIIYLIGVYLIKLFNKEDIKLFINSE